MTTTEQMLLEVLGTENLTAKEMRHLIQHYSSVISRSTYQIASKLAEARFEEELKIQLTQGI